MVFNSKGEKLLRIGCFEKMNRQPPGDLKMVTNSKNGKANKLYNTGIHLLGRQLSLSSTKPLLFIH